MGRREGGLQNGSEKGGGAGQVLAMLKGGGGAQNVLGKLLHSNFKFKLY